MSDQDPIPAPPDEPDDERDLRQWVEVRQRARDIFVRSVVAAAQRPDVGHLSLESVARGAFVAAQAFAEELDLQAKDPSRRSTLETRARVKRRYRAVLYAAEVLDDEPGRTIYGPWVATEEDALQGIQETIAAGKPGAYENPHVEVRTE